jgi:Na+/phosphate symporter
MVNDPKFCITIILLLIIGGDSIYLIYYLNKQNAPIRTTVVQLIGVLLFVPLVFLLAFWDKIESQVTATVLGAFVGYIFNIISLKEEWNNK